MVSRLARLALSLLTAAVLVALVVGLPVALWLVAGWPLPSSIPRLGDVTLAIEQRNVGAEVVIGTLAAILWALWAQLVWALAWELIVNGQRLARGARTRPAPLVVGPVNTLVVRLVSSMMAATVLATASTSAVLPATPAMAAEPDDDRLDDDGALADHPHAAVARGPRWEVGAGESLWSIAEATLGDGARSGEILALNPRIASARDVGPGTVLWMPVGAAVPNDRVPVATVGGDPGPVPAAEVEVVAGDNLWKLSEHRLAEGGRAVDVGSVAAYVDDVVDANRTEIDDPDLIFPGQVFQFPAMNPAPVTPEGPSRLEYCAEPIDATPPPMADAGGPREDGVALDESGGHDRIGEVDQPPPSIARTDDDGTAAGPIDGDDGDDDDDDVVAPAAFGFVGAVLAAGALDLIRRRRRYRMAHRRPGFAPAPPDEGLLVVEHSLIRQADPEGWAWIDRAMASLAGRPVWEGETVAQPAIVRLSPDELEVEFGAPDPMAAPVPWERTDDDQFWTLNRTVPASDLPEPATPNPIPTLVTLGDDLMVNLEALGVVAVRASGADPMDVVRSIVHELATSPSASAIDIRSTVTIDGIEGHRLVRQQRPVDLAAELTAWLDDTAAELARCSSVNTYGHRLRFDGDPLVPVVVVTDAAGAAPLGHVLDRAARRTLPIAALVVASDEPEVACATIELDDGGARLHPWGIGFAPQLVDAEQARQLGALELEAAAGSDAPLAVSVSGPGRPPDDEPPDRVGEIDVLLLGDIEVEGLAEELTSQQASLVSFLAYRGESGRDTIIDALWDGQAISKSRFPNLLAETRAKVGRHHFPEARNGRYELVGVTTDLERFEAGLGRAGAQDGDAEADTLRCALELVRGIPFSPPGRRFWTWVADHSHAGARVEASIADAAARLAELERGARRLDGAKWACERGLAASPTDLTLTTVLTEIYLEMGKPGLARRLVENWEDQIGRLDCGEPSDEPRKRLAG